MFEVTDGIIDHRDLNIGPVYQCSIKKLTYNDDDYIHCEFIGDRPMEENIADLDRMFKTDAQFLFDMYNTQKAIYTCSAHEEVLPVNRRDRFLIPCAINIKYTRFLSYKGYRRELVCQEQELRASLLAHI